MRSLINILDFSKEEIEDLMCTATDIIENPEAHIHPKGQAELGRLLASCASTGVQIFVETHSDFHCYYFFYLLFSNIYSGYGPHPRRARDKNISCILYDIRSGFYKV